MRLTSLKHFKPCNPLNTDQFCCMRTTVCFTAEGSWWIKTTSGRAGGKTLKCWTLSGHLQGPWFLTSAHMASIIYCISLFLSVALILKDVILGELLFSKCAFCLQSATCNPELPRLLPSYKPLWKWEKQPKLTKMRSKISFPSAQFCCQGT